MKADELKEYILRDSERIVTILEFLGFHKIKNSDSSDYITCALENHNNPNGFSVLKDNGFCKSFSTHMNFSGYIFDLYMEIKKCKFGQCMRDIHKIFGLKYEYNPNKEDKPKDSILDFFKKYDRKYKKSNTSENKGYVEDEIFKNASNIIPYLPWIKNDGILPNIQEEFSVHYNFEYNRVGIVWRSWKNGDIVGVTGRTVKPSEVCDLLGIPKYMSIFPFKKSRELFGLWENKKHIEDEKEIIIVESEKAVMQLKSKGFKNAVAVGCHNISEEQVKIILSLDIANVVIAFDKDVPEDVVKSECGKFQGMRNVYYIWDELDLLQEKESIGDKHYKIINVLLKRYKRKFKYKEE